MLGGNPKLQWAWICPHDHMICHESTNPFGVTGGNWDCKSKRKGKATICHLKCDAGLKENRSRSSNARCQKMANNGFRGGEWRMAADRKHETDSGKDRVCE